MNRRWEIIVEKTIDSGATINTRFTCWAPTAQQATKSLVDLTTNNGRVVHFSVTELDE